MNQKSFSIALIGLFWLNVFNDQLPMVIGQHYHQQHNEQAQLTAPVSQTSPELTLVQSSSNHPHHQHLPHLSHVQQQQLHQPQPSPEQYESSAEENLKTASNEHQYIKGNDEYLKEESKEPDHGYGHQPYGFGYNIEDGYGNKQWRHEKSSSPHQVMGSYGFKDKNGIMREVEYVADKYGFRAIVKTNEPGMASNDPAYVKIQSNPAPLEYYQQSPTEYPPSASSQSAAKTKETYVHESQVVGYKQQTMYQPSTHQTTSIQSNPSGNYLLTAGSYAPQQESHKGSVISVGTYEPNEYLINPGKQENKY